MNRLRRSERRSDRRYPVVWKLEGKVSGLPPSHEEVVRGRIENINRGGLCLLTKRPIEHFSVLQCEIFPSGMHVGIPTMMEVLWGKPNPEGSGMRVGLRFLI